MDRTFCADSLTGAVAFFRQIADAIDDGARALALFGDLAESLTQHFRVRLR